MPTPVSFVQTADGDWDLSQGLRQTSDLATFVRQKLSQTLSFWLGEWFLDLRQGIPMQRDVIGQKPDLALVESLLRRTCLKTSGVGSVRSLTVAFDNRTRRASVVGEVATSEGDITFGPFVVTS